MRPVIFLKLLITLAFFPVFSLAKSAKILAPGESQFSFQYGRVQIDNSFNGFAQAESMHYRRPVTWAEFIGGHHSFNVSRKLKTQLLPINAIVGFISPSLQSSQSRYLPVTRFGLSPHWTLELSLPFVQDNYQRKTQFEANDKLRQALKEMPEAITSYKRQTDQVESGSDTHLGDLEVLNRLALIESFNFNANFIAGVTIPTNEFGVETSEVIIDPEEGHIDYSFGTELEFFHTAVLTSEFNVRYTFQTDDSIELFEESEGDEYVIGKIHRNVGDRLNWSLIAKLKINDSIALSGFYEFENKKSDQFDNNNNVKAYAATIGPTNRINHLVGGGLTFKSYTLSTQSAKASPYFMSINYSQSVAGENVLQDKNLGLSLGMLL